MKRRVFFNSLIVCALMPWKSLKAAIKSRPRIIYIAEEIYGPLKPPTYRFRACCGCMVECQGYSATIITAHKPKERPADHCWLKHEIGDIYIPQI